MVRRIPLGIVLGVCALLVSVNSAPIHAAEPVTITFEDITNKPFGHDFLPPFFWRGVFFSGGGLQRTDAAGTWYSGRNRNPVQMQFPPGSTDVSFDIDGRGEAVLCCMNQRQYLAIQIWNGDLETGHLVATLPIPATYSPPSHKITIPGPLSRVSIYMQPKPPATFDHWYYVDIDNVRYTPPDPEPTITFDPVLPDHARVLTHNYGSYPYPSPLQTQDGAIRVQATVLVNNEPAAGKTIHFRLIDPRDTAPYVIQANDASLGDNADGPGGLNALGQTTTSAVSDGAGRVSVTLRTTSFAAGDNYQIEASGRADFPCALSCAKSGVFTAWKRVYVEYNKMFRTGAYITANVAPGAKAIEVSDVNVFPQPPFALRLIHAPSINGTGTFYSETVTITRARAAGWRPFGVNPGTLYLDPDPAVPGIQHGYFSGELVPGDPTPRTYLADAAGVVRGQRSQDYFLLDSRFVKKAFDDAFVEHVWLTDAVPGSDTDIAADEPRLLFDGILPYESKVDEPNAWEQEWLTVKWIRHAQRAGQNRIAEPNHFAVFAAKAYQGQHGVTTVASRYNDLWLFVAQIGSATHVAEALIHELAHQWRVNKDWQPNVVHLPAARTGGHCDTAFGTVMTMYDRALKCVMHSTMFGSSDDPERNDGIVGFHYARLGPARDSEYLHIRRRAEPVPQNEQQRDPLQ